MFNFPLAAMPAGRKGMSAGVGLYYNSKLYDPYTDNVCAYDPNTNEWDCALAQQVYPSPQGGWRYGMQYKLQ